MGRDANASEPENDVPKQVWEILHEFLLGIKDPTLDLREPHLKLSFASTYVLIIFVYAVLVLGGFLGNVAVLAHITYNKLHRNETYAFLLNNCVSDIIKCVVVIPISLFVLLIQNWVLGEMLCSILPMIQVCYFILIHEFYTFILKLASNIMSKLFDFLKLLF